MCSDMFRYKKSSTKHNLAYVKLCFVKDFLKFYVTLSFSKYIFALFWSNQFLKFVEKFFESGLIVFWVVYFELRIAPLFTYCCSFPNKSPGDHKWTANLKLIRYSNLSKTKHFSQSFKNIESTTLITKEEKNSMPNSAQKIWYFQCK